MFDSLEERIKQDDQREISPREKVVKALLISGLTALLIVAIYLAVRFTEV